MGNTITAVGGYQLLLKGIRVRPGTLELEVVRTMGIPLGKRLRPGGPHNPWTSVIGVVGDGRQRDLSDPPEPMLYRPATQVIREGLALAAVGLVVGVAGALVLTRFLGDPVVRPEGAQPATYLAVAATMAAISTLSCYIPARRAAAADPLETMRVE